MISEQNQKIIKNAIRDVPDFPKPGISFKDISTLLMNPEISKLCLDCLEEQLKDIQFDVIAGLESRGFIFGFALAQRLNKPFVLIRKEGKLPGKKIKQSYGLEYGQSTIEIHEDQFPYGTKVLIHDDLLATGGTAGAAETLINKVGGEVVGFSFLAELTQLQGRKNFIHDVYSVVQYDD